MRCIAVLLFLSCCCAAYGQQPQADQNNALVLLKTVDAYNDPVRVLVSLHNKGDGQVYEDSTNSKGEAQLLVPNGASYALLINSGHEFATLNIPKAPNVEYRQTLQLTDEDLFTATKTVGVLKLIVVDDRKNGIKEPVKLQSRSTGKVYMGQLNEQGIGYLRLPINDTYLISFKGAPRYDQVFMRNKPYYRLRYTIAYEGSKPGMLHPSVDTALFRLTFTDLYGMLVANEPFYLEGQTDGTVVKKYTDKDGLAQIRVPIGQTYRLSSNFNKNFTAITIPAEESTYTYDIDFSSLSSADWEKRIAERLKRLKAREEAWKTGTWKLPETDTVVSTVFERNKQWTNKLVVADVTGSMSPYIDQFKLWFELSYETQEPMQLVMFNDGNSKRTSEKKIGSTGGIYTCNYCTPQEVFFGLEEAMRAGGGGDGPENDLEAVLKAVKESSNYTDLILIADNYSPVRDMVLLSEVSVPVKVILCGVNYYIHEDYLNIAYRTGGSVHTIEEDIIELSKKVEGDVIKIGKNQYVLRNGQFILVE